MKVLFIGLGSIGSRHLRLLRQMTPCQILHYQSGGKKERPPEAGAGVVLFDDLNEAAIKGKPDFAVISNPTALHAKTALTLAQTGIPFLLEKPVSHSLEHLTELSAMVQNKKLPVMIGFQLRHHPGFQRLAEFIKGGAIGRPVSLQGYVGQYLPFWRPETDYRLSYSSKTEMGGGVILDLCHEIDVALSIMGSASRVSCVAGHYSDLETDAEDCAEITLEHGDRKVSHLHLNCIERGYQWWTKVVGTEGSILWDYGNGFTEVTSANGERRRFEDPKECDRDFLFSAQLASWLKLLRGETEAVATLDEGIEVTRVAVAAKQAAREGRAVRL